MYFSGLVEDLQMRTQRITEAVSRTVPRILI